MEGSAMVVTRQSGAVAMGRRGSKWQIGNLLKGDSKERGGRQS
jgi:hypothetical protein